MKKLIALVVAIIVLFAIYRDVSRGSLPTVGPVTNPSTPVKTNNYVVIVPKPGDTILTIFEKYENTGHNISIEKMTSDFQKLNDGLEPIKIQPGKSYKIPIYPKKQ